MWEVIVVIVVCAALGWFIAAMFDHRRHVLMVDRPVPCSSQTGPRYFLRLPFGSQGDIDAQELPDEHNHT